MDASRLLAVVSDIESEYKSGLSQSLKELIQQYTAARDAPAQDNSAAIQKVLDILEELATDSSFAHYPPSKAAVLSTIDGSGRVGPGFQVRLAEILSVAGQTTAGIVAGLTRLQADLEAYRKACIQTKAGLEFLGVTPHAIPAGEFEAGILIPEQLVDRKLGALAKELEHWNKIVRGFKEIAGDDEREVTVAHLSSGSYEIYLPLALIAAGHLPRTIDKVLDWYLKILEIRKRRIELQELGAPVAEVSAIKKFEKDFIDQEIRALAIELVKETHPKIDVARRNELETQLTIHIRQIARFVDKGGTVEVDAAPPEAPDEPAAPEGESATPEGVRDYEHQKKEAKRLRLEFDRTSHILEAGRALRRLPERLEPILQLPDSGSADAAADLAKPSRRRG